MIAVKGFPRYGRIEGRFMGLGRPADPEHIGDTFLWMKRSEKGPNTFSQTIKDLQPGRLYSLKMFSCDYDDLVHPKAKKIEETKSTGTVVIEGVDLDAKRSFTEVYASTPEPKIPVCITYYWKVFRAKAPTAKLTVSDWQSEKEAGASFGQEQTFNFLELQPYWELSSSSPPAQLPREAPVAFPPANDKSARPPTRQRSCTRKRPSYGSCVM